MKLQKIQDILIYTDGACSGNPGPGGFGSIVIADLKQVTELGDYFPATTNNRMEMQAVISALEFVQSNYTDLKNMTVYTDSVYVIRGITQWIFGWKKNGWKNSEGQEVTNQDLWQKLEKLVLAMAIKIKWTYVRGHKGIAGNERCDVIGVSFSKKDEIYLYEGSAENYHFDVTVLPFEEPLPEMKSHKTGEKKAVWYISLINGVVTKYQTWSACEAAVKGRPGVKFKKVSSNEEESEVLSSWGFSSSK